MIGCDGNEVVAEESIVGCGYVFARLFLQHYSIVCAANAVVIKERLCTNSLFRKVHLWCSAVMVRSSA